MGLPEIALGAIIAAWITATVSLLSLVISKEQKTSEFRQEWIDALRSEISRLIAHVNALHGSSLVKHKNRETQWAAERDDFVGINDATANIRLRLNPKEGPSREVLSAIEGLERLLAPGSHPHHADLNRAEKQLVAKAQVVLSAEWKRVKQGEPSFVWAKALTIAVICAGLIALSYGANVAWR